MRNKIGSMYVGVLLIEGENNFGLTISVVFLLRRTLFVGITFGLLDYPGLQMLLFIVSSVFYLCYLSSFTIYASSFTYKLEYLNESIFLITCYHFLLFTNILGKDDPYTPELLGTSMIISMVLLLAITAIIMLSLSCKVLFAKLMAKKN